MGAQSQPRAADLSRQEAVGPGAAGEQALVPRGQPVAVQLICPNYQPAACTMVIFGASGDLTRRKLIPALYKLDREGMLTDAFRVVGFGRQDMDTEAFRGRMRGALEEFAGLRGESDEAWQRFGSRLHYVRGQYDSPQSFVELQRFLARHCPQDRAAQVYYMALPPTVAQTVLERMRETGFVAGARDEIWPKIVVEKPFGLDLASARRLNELLGGMFGEPQIYRADHYLAKSTVQNLMVFRFGNAIWEPLWNAHYIDCVQITAAERIGVEGRGGYYEQAGVVRDMVQNHVLQVLALIAMEPPVAQDSESVHDKKLEVFKSLEPLAPDDYAFGQYEGYRAERHVEAGSTTPTFAAIRWRVNSWRWRGVPFYVRCGKNLARNVTEVAIRFKSVPLCVLSEEACRNVGPNTLFIRIQPNEGIRLQFNVKAPTRGEEVATAGLDFRYADLGVPMADAYERIVLDCLCDNCQCGRQNRLWRADAVEAAWRVVTPLLNDTAVPDEPATYAPGSWGPEEAEGLLRRDGRRWLVSE